MNYATTSMLSSSSSAMLTGRLCGLMCSSVSVSLLCRLLTCVSRLDDRGAGVWSSIPSGHMHVQPVPEGRSCAMRWITGIFMSIATRLELKLSKADFLQKRHRVSSDMCLVRKCVQAIIFRGVTTQFVDSG